MDLPRTVHSFKRDVEKFRRDYEEPRAQIGETHQGEQSLTDSVEFAQRNQLQKIYWGNPEIIHVMEYPSHTPPENILEIRRGPMVKGIRPRQAVERLKPDTQVFK